jgi:Arc/MetJ-type ribon-helix-helix transcriptional regulator
MKQLSLVISEKDEKDINDILAKKLAINKSDFVRQAIREKIAREVEARV